ncbi:MAG: alpha-ketoacid dehydrogenase subunit beta [Labrys sp. (in: a-proteobacteria)]|jgi:pyruvate/2-oxoglutarate/acetoin dehydrogenase E1 component
MIETTYRDALRLALEHAMVEDPSIIVAGEEVGVYGGAYGVTKGLIDRFGADRVLDTPISEAGLVGAGVGAAMAGLRPVVELMYVDFAGIAMDQIANQAAKIRAMFGGQIGVPMVLRTQGGTGRSAAAQHSQSLEAWFMHTPGLRVVMPGTVSDAYHLLRMALRKPDPVIFIEHKALYTMKGALDVERPDGGWGESVVRRAGRDAVIVTYSRMLHVCLAAADRLAAEGIELAVVDLRTLNPLDIEPTAALVRGCGRAAVVTEACLTAGPAAEIGMRLVETCFDWLEEPVIRIAGEDVPIPVAPALEAASIPTADLIVDTMRRLVRRR